MMPIEKHANDNKNNIPMDLITLLICPHCCSSHRIVRLQNSTLFAASLGLLEHDNDNKL